MDRSSKLFASPLKNPQADEPTIDPVTEFLKKDVDVTLLLANLQLTPEQRVRKIEQTLRNVAEFRKAGAHIRQK